MQKIRSLHKSSVNGVGMGVGKGILSVEDLGALHRTLFLQYCILSVFQMKKLGVRGQACLRSPSLDCKLGLPAAKARVSNNTISGPRILPHTGDLQGVETGAFQAIVFQQRGLLDTPRPFLPSLGRRTDRHRVSQTVECQELNLSADRMSFSKSQP